MSTTKKPTAAEMAATLKSVAESLSATTNLTEACAQKNGVKLEHYRYDPGRVDVKNVKPGSLTDRAMKAAEQREHAKGGAK